MRRFLLRWAVLVATLTLAQGGLVLGAGSAYANDGEWIESFDVVYAIQRDGSMHVRETIVWQFPAAERRGIIREIQTVEDAPGQDGQRRVYGMHDVRTFDEADEQIPRETYQDGDFSIIQVGDPDRPFRGPTQRTYVVEYTLDDVIDDAGATAEFDWNIRLEGDVEAQSLTATIVAPGEVEESHCFYGPVGVDLTCPTETAGSQVAFQAPRTLGEQDGLTIGAALPRSAFDELTPRLTDDPNPSGVGNSYSTGVPSGLAQLASLSGIGIGIGLPILGAVLAGRRIARSRRFADVAPGVVPRNHKEAPTTTRRRGGPVPVRFEPPDDLGPGETGLLIDEKAEERDATAVFMDLVSRGQLRLVPSGDEFAVGTIPNVENTNSREAALLRAVALDIKGANRTKDRLREVGGLVSLDKATHLGRALVTTQDELDAFGRTRGWFQPKPRVSIPILALGVAVVGGFWLMIISLISMRPIDHYLGFALPVPSWLILLLGAALTLAMGLLLRRFTNRRTPLGQALTEQAEGFRTYLVTAEADRIRFEEAEQIFSRYLPYAIAFGVADQWAATFDEVQDRARRQGVSVASPAWASDGSVRSDVGSIGRSTGRLSRRSRRTSGSSGAGSRSPGGRSRSRRSGRRRSSGGGRSGSRSRSW